MMKPPILPAAVLVAIWAIFGYPHCVLGYSPHQSNSEPGTRERPGDVAAVLQGMSPEEQVRYLRAARDEGTWNAVLSYHLGNALFRQGKADSAVSYYRESVSLDSTYSKAWVNLGLALEELKRFDEARTGYEKALQVNPDDVLAHCHLGYFHYVRRGYSTAVGHYRRALEIDPRSAQAHYYLGMAFADAKIFREAIGEWEKVVAMAPDSDLGKTAAENIALIRQYLELEER